MKKLVLAMACVLSLGLLASCKQGVQDVKLTNQEKTESSKYVGTTTFSATKKTITGTAANGTVTYAYTDATGYTISANAKLFKSSVQKSKSYDTVESNVEGSWTLTVSYDETYTVGGTSTTSKGNTVSFTIYKVGDKYYCDNANYALTSSTSTSTAATTETEVTFTAGSPDEAEFTVTGLGIKNSILWSSISFKRA